MAVLSTDELKELRRNCELGVTSAGLPLNYVKLQINQALQAIEDDFEAHRSAIGTAIDSATTPFTFTANQKKRLVGYWMLQKFKREGI